MLKSITMKKYKTAVIFTGSGGTISQEAAVLDQLIKQGKLTLNEKDTILIASGSGAFNLIGVNACFSVNSAFSWNEFYKEDFLRKIKDDEIYIKVDPVHWLTLPQRKLINEMLKKRGFKKISDLPFESVILTSLASENKSFWLKSYSKKIKDTELSDILIATSAIPVLFPSQQLNSTSDEFNKNIIGAHNEGAIFGLFHKFKKQLNKIVMEHGQFEKIVIISPKRLFDLNAGINHDLSLMLPQEKYQFMQFLNHISINGFLTFLIKLQKANSKNKLAKSITISMPDMENDYGLLDYSCQIEKYQVVYDWFEKNPNRLTIDISDFINEIAFIPSFSEKYYSEIK
jgi:hypothetical protein